MSSLMQFGVRVVPAARWRAVGHGCSTMHSTLTRAGRSAAERASPRGGACQRLRSPRSDPIGTGARGMCALAAAGGGGGSGSGGGGGTEVVVMSKLTSSLVPLLEARCDTQQARFIPMDPLNPDLEVLAQTEVLIADPPCFAPVADRCSNLVWMQSTFAGCDALLKTTTKRDYKCTRLAGVFGMRMAEYTMLHILSIERRLHETYQDQSRRVWGMQDPKPSYRMLNGLVVGILGVGDIGSAIVDAANCFGMTVHGCRRSAQEVSGVERMYTSEQLPEFLSGCDYVVNVMPSTAQTRGMLSGGILQACKGAVLINVGRGDVVDEASMLEALERGWLRHAVLDVFVQEPLPEKSPLWSHPKVTITPHVAAETFPKDVVNAFADNLKLYQAQQPLQHLLDWERGY